MRVCIVPIASLMVDAYPRGHTVKVVMEIAQEALDASRSNQDVGTITLTVFNYSMSAAACLD